MLLGGLITCWLLPPASRRVRRSTGMLDKAAKVAAAARAIGAQVQLRRAYVCKDAQRLLAVGGGAHSLQGLTSLLHGGQSWLTAAASTTAGACALRRCCTHPSPLRTATLSCPPAHTASWASEESEQAGCRRRTSICVPGSGLLPGTVLQLLHAATSPQYKTRHAVLPCLVSCSVKAGGCFPKAGFGSEFCDVMRPAAGGWRATRSSSGFSQPRGPVLQRFLR
jgi:hypothetical protein